MGYVIPVLIFAGLGVVSGILLTVASKIFEVKTDPRVDEINNILPQANCGSCGYSGCSGYADAIVNSNAPVNMCRPGGAECAKKIAAVMGTEAGDVAKMTAVVCCSGECGAARSKYEYDGQQTCISANRFYNGSKECTHACLGFGDCAAACPQDAITIVDGLAHVDRRACIGCGICAKTCPNHIIKIRDITKQIDVCCSSTDIGKIVRSVCAAGCIGCKMCEKKCENDAIHVIDNLARIDYDKCIVCGKCADACPTKAIRRCGTTYEVVDGKVTVKKDA